MKRPSSLNLLIRTLLVIIGAAAGLGLANLLLSGSVLTGPNNLLYLTLLGALVGYLLSAPLAGRTERLWRKVEERARQIPPEAVLAGGTGATLALLVTVLLNNVLAQVPGFTWYWSLLIALVLVVATSSFFVANRNLFGRFMAAEREEGPEDVRSAEKVIDSSALIDGRIVGVVESNFLEGRILIPKFVLLELQKVADSGDPLRRRRGRRGLEMVDRLAQQQQLPTAVIADDPPDLSEVDEKLMSVASRRGAGLITTDYNLERVASLQGIRVLNLNGLANSVKATYLPGERLQLAVVREGREAGQGLAYLEDGTMVVIEDAAELVGSTIEIVVTSSLQTNMGRMIFARPARAEDD